MSYKIRVTTVQPSLQKNVRRSKVKQKKEAKPSYIIEVCDEHNTIVEKREAPNTLKRSNIINELREFYNTDEVKYVDINGKSRTKKTIRKSTIPAITFDTEDEIRSFFDENPGILYSRIIEAVEEGLAYNKKIIKLFELGTTSQYLTAPRSKWDEGLNQSLSFFHDDGNYEMCAKCKKLLAML